MSQASYAHSFTLKQKDEARLKKLMSKKKRIIQIVKKGLEHFEKQLGIYEPEKE